MADELNYKPPTDIPNKSDFGGKVPDGIYQSKCIGWRLNDNKPNNAWVEFENLDYPEEGKFSMNVFLPTKEALNSKAAELKGSVPDEQLRERVLKSFFHYGQTLKAAGVSIDLPIKEALDALKGWTGKAIYETPQGFNTRVKKIMGAKEAKAVVSGGSAPQVF